MLPLSLQQERLWALIATSPDNPFYNVAFRLRLDGPLDADVLAASVARVGAAHPCLRGRFTDSNGIARLTVAEPEETVLRRAELSDAEGLDGAALDALCEREARQCFRLDVEPPLRTLLVTVADQRHVLVVVVHHLVFDAWSYEVFISDLARCYGALLAGREPALAAADGQGDYVEWQRGQLQNGSVRAAVDHWVSELQDPPRPLRWYANGSRPAVQCFDGATHSFEVPEPLRSAAADHARRNGLTLSMLLLAVYAIFIARHTGEEDVVIGVPVANRGRAHTQSAIGFFVNTVPIRLAVPSEMTVSCLLARVRERALGAYAHQEAPIELVLERLGSPRTLGHHPLFQATFQLLHRTDAPPLGPHVNTRFEWIEKHTTQFDLSLDMELRDEQLTGSFEYSTALFDPPTIGLFAARFLALLDAIVGEPAARVADLVHNPAEPQRGEAPDGHSAGSCALHEPVAARAAHEPGASAYVETASGRTWTFAELERAASSEAQRLREMGVGAETPVGVCLPRSGAAAIALLAISKAGGMALPWDVATPATRLLEIINRVAPLVVYGDDEVADRLADCAVPVIAVRNAAGRLQTAVGPSAQIISDGAAYAITTSGSTGAPNLVVVSHRAVATTTAGVADAMQLTSADRVLHLASLSFDVAFEEQFASWSVGACVIAAGEHDLGPEDLLHLTEQHKITVWNVAAPLWHALVDACVSGRQPPKMPTSLRLIVVGSDTVSADSCVRWQAAYGSHPLLINAYGATETAITATAGAIAPEALRRGSVPIGQPLVGVRAHVLDEQGRPAGSAVPGELYLGGEGLARGYHGRPSATAERFLPDPWGKPGSRLFRTGDRAVVRPDGSLEHLGRTDRQLKIRGVRVEPAEVEAYLRGLPEVAEAAVCASAPVGGEQAQLVAHLELSDDAEQAAVTEQARVKEWAAVHDADIFNSVDDTSDPTFNVSGWTSSFTGKSIPAEEMREWVATTVDRLARYGAARVLELGCGTGLLLFRLASKCREYVGTDISAIALGHVASACADSPELEHVELLKADARNWDWLGGRRFELTILNSVIQYFPSEEYLDGALQEAIAATDDGGTVFVGDVRDLRLAAAFHREVLRRRGAPTNPAAVEDAVADRLAAESELLVDPRFFEHLAATHPRISHIDLLPKLGHADNELTRYRYDVGIALTGPEPEPTLLDPIWLPEPAKLAELLIADASAVGLMNAADARVAAELEIAPDVCRVHPGEITALARRHGKRASVRLSASGEPGRLDVVVAPNRQPVRFPFSRSNPTAEREPLTNLPLRSQQRRAVIACVVEQARAALPSALVPSRVAVVDRMPRLPSGKVDHGRLPELRLEPAPIERSVTAGGVLEANLLALWRAVLGRDDLGLDSNFFELGGDSILMIQIVARAGRDGYTMSVADIFEHQTVRALASVLRSRGAATATGAEDEREPEDAPLTPMERWFFERIPHDRDHYNQLRWFRFDAAEHEPRSIAAALRTVVSVHDTFRLQFAEDSGGWRHTVADTTELPIRLLEIAPAHEEERAAMLGAVIDQLHAGLDIGRAPLAAAAIVREPRWLSLGVVAHHLIIDDVSWQVLADDLDEALCAGASPRPPATPFLTWAARHAGELGPTEADFYDELAQRVPSTRARHASSPRRADRLASIDVELTPMLTRRLGALQRDHGGTGPRMHEIVATACAAALEPDERSGQVHFDIEGHGRETLRPDVDVSRTIGWFSSRTPVVLDAAGRRPVELLNATVCYLRKLPRRGVGYGAWLTTRATARCGRGIDAADVNLNFAGRRDHQRRHAFETLCGPTGSFVSPLGALPYLLDIDAGIVDDRLAVRWLYSEAAIGHDVVEASASRFADALEQIAADVSVGQRPRQTVISRARDVIGRAVVRPASALQEAMWLGHLLHGKDDVNLQQATVEITGALAPDLLEEAWRRVIERNDGLRLSVGVDRNGEPVQRISADADAELAWLDLATLSADAQERALAAAAERERTGVDLSATPMARLLLARLAAERHRLLWTDHHVLLDGWSSYLVLDELIRTYDALERGDDPVLPEPARLIDHLRAVERRRDAALSRHFWSEHLAGATLPGKLPDDGEMSPIEPAHTRYKTLEGAALADLAARAQRNTGAAPPRATVSMLAELAWATVLADASSVEDVTFGVTTAGRDGMDADRVIGSLITMVPLHLDLSTKRPLPVAVDELVRYRREVARHQHAQLHEIAAAAGVADPVSMLTSILTVQNYPARLRTRTAAGVRFAPAFAAARARSPLHLLVDGNGPIRLTFDVGRVRTSTAASLLERFRAELLRFLRGERRTFGGAQARRAPPPAWIAPSQLAHTLGRRVMTPVERDLAMIWSEILGLEINDPTADFFDLGGSSLRATQLAATLRRTSGRGVSVVDVYRNPTLERLAAHLHKTAVSTADEGDTTRRARARRAAYTARPRHHD